MAETSSARSGLPRQVLSAWHGQLPRRRETLTPERVTTTAIQIADQDGIDAVTIRNLAASMGYATMAVYRHVSSREELVLLMLDRALGPPPPLRRRQSWQAGLRRWAAALFDAYLAHPWLLDVALPGMPVTPNHAMWVEHALAVTDAIGLTTGQRLEAALLIDGHVRNIAGLARAGQAAARPDRDQRLADVRAVADEQRYPHFRGVLETGELHDDTGPGIAFGMDVILAGLAGKGRAKARAGADRDVRTRATVR